VRLIVSSGETRRSISFLEAMTREEFCGRRVTIRDANAPDAG
jgi:hypothetical protein